MNIFKAMAQRGHEQVIFNFDRRTGLRAIIAIHDTTLGPALGGCRLFPYGSEDAAIEDVLRLSEGMTYKAAAAGIDFGGGQAVILEDPVNRSTSEALRAFGRFVETLQGRYITGEDVGINESDLVQVAKETHHVIGLPKAYGGSGDTGDMTAQGVLTAIRASLEYRFGSPSLTGRRLAIQGLGKVGYQLARRAMAEGAHVIAADINPHVVGKASAELNIEPADPWTILETPCDVLAPCALGNVVNRGSIDRLACHIIAGSANNQLEDMEMGRALRERNILYAPDFIVNAGGLIQGAAELQGYSQERAKRQIEDISPLLSEVFRRSDESGLSTVEVAMAIVEERIDMLHAIRRIFTRPS
ncbi:MAG: leucine dehydrogenase [Sulfobacillus thermotolerans]|uniref:Leucine dehydrogenase n=1 Tax=Sulfobacillus thermotolerans TaxID=338644 RepID=A0ABN5GY83_9FIRM|nr:leucine dehydrogenase [Sulfobacillus thermotolerans]MCY0907356.1 leucine dehydrogenase [Sulfobacillus thermotolerans]